MLEDKRQRNDSGCTCSSYFKEWKYKIRTENNQIVGSTEENSQNLYKLEVR